LGQEANTIINFFVELSSKGIGFENDSPDPLKHGYMASFGNESTIEKCYTASKEKKKPVDYKKACPAYDNVRFYGIDIRDDKKPQMSLTPPAAPSPVGIDANNALLNSYEYYFKQILKNLELVVEEYKYEQHITSYIVKLLNETNYYFTILNPQKPRITNIGEFFTVLKSIYIGPSNDLNIDNYVNTFETSLNNTASGIFSVFANIKKTFTGLSNMDPKYSWSELYKYIVDKTYIDLKSSHRNFNNKSNIISIIDNLELICILHNNGFTYNQQMINTLNSMVYDDVYEFYSMLTAPFIDVYFVIKTISQMLHNIIHYKYPDFLNVCYLGNRHIRNIKALMLYIGYYNFDPEIDHSNNIANKRCLPINDLNLSNEIIQLQRKQINRDLYTRELLVGPQVSLLQARLDAIVGESNVGKSPNTVATHSGIQPLGASAFLSFPAMGDSGSLSSVTQLVPGDQSSATQLPTTRSPVIFSFKSSKSKGSPESRKHTLLSKPQGASFNREKNRKEGKESTRTLLTESLGRPVEIKEIKNEPSKKHQT